jgi:hypothetical protein
MEKQIIRITNNVKDYTQEEYTTMIGSMFGDLLTDNSMKDLYKQLRRKKGGKKIA